MIYIKPIKAWIVHAHMKITANFEHIFIMAVLISGAKLEAYTSHSVAGHSVRDSAPRQAPLIRVTAESLPM